MKYIDGQIVLLGDHVRLGGEDGVVVCDIDGDQFTIENPKEQWGYLKKGVMIEFPNYGLLHYESPDEDLELVSRKII